MTRVLPVAGRTDSMLVWEWSFGAAEAAGLVPAEGAQAVHWTVRGWAEVALGCVVSGARDPFRGLDLAIRQSEVPCAGPFARRLRTLRSRGGSPPPWYFGAEPGPEAPVAMDARTAQACRDVAGFCDRLSAEIAVLRELRPGPADRPQLWARIADHLCWGERLRPRPCDYRYEVVHAAIDQDDAWRCWLSLPDAEGPRIVLVEPVAGATSAPVRQRVCHGVHNGAHLDHLAALAADGGSGLEHAAIEFGAGLLAAESFAVAVELQVAVECVRSGFFGAARQLVRGFVERIGRIPGYQSWYEAEGRTRSSHALTAAARIHVSEFSALPRLAANYVTGPLTLLARGSVDPLLPESLSSELRECWASAVRWSPAAAYLDERAMALL